jgi:hypothetical protein
LAARGCSRQKAMVVVLLSTTVNFKVIEPKIMNAECVGVVDDA